MSDAARLLLLAMLVAANALFVVGEYSVVTARRASLAAREEAGSRRAGAALRLMDDPVRVISTVQVGITAVSILTGAVGEPAVRALLGGGPPRAVSFLIALAVVTYFMVVLGELVPKAVSLERAESLALVVARPLEVTSRLLHPVVWALEESARLALRPFGVGQVVAGQSIRSAEELLYNVFDFASREARDVMVPAPDVFWIDGGMPPQAALDRVIGGAHTRFPVGDGSLDRLVGVVHAREIAAAARDGAPATIAPLARPAFIVPETKDLGALLRELRERREQLAVVMSEYGTTAGIVTLEDILEEIVGEIEGEYELPDATMRWLDDRTVLVSGSLTIDDFNETTGAELPQDGPRTLAGLVFDELGRGPSAGDAVTVAGVGMQVEQVEGARIIRLRVAIPLPARERTSAPQGVLDP
jgi:putative hemolysin